MAHLTRSQQRKLDGEALQASLAMQALRAATQHLAPIETEAAKRAGDDVWRALRRLVHAYPGDKFIRPGERDGDLSRQGAMGPRPGAAS